MVVGVIGADSDENEAMEWIISPLESCWIGTLKEIYYL